MTPDQRMARSTRADAAWEEFVGPMIEDLKAEYARRLSEVATTELASAARSDKISTLSVALKVVGALEAGMREIVRDGELAAKERLKADRIENMSDAAQRLLKITGY